MDFLASFGGVTTAAASMTKVGHQVRSYSSETKCRQDLDRRTMQEAYGRHQSLGLRRSWLDPNFSASSDLSCTSVMVREHEIERSTLKLHLTR